MADMPPDTDSGGDPRVGTDRGTVTGMARWQKVVGVIGLVVFIGLGIVMFAAGGHGPGRHGPGALVPVDDHEGNTPPIDGAPVIDITAEALAFRPDRIELIAGQPVNAALTSADIPHDLVVDEIAFHLAADRGETVIGGLVFPEPGAYTGYCSIRGHREAGMEIVIVVTSSDSAGHHAPPLSH